MCRAAVEKSVVLYGERRGGTYGTREAMEVSGKGTGTTRGTEK